MSDLAQRALDTATQLGADYADARVVRRLEQSADVKSGRVEGLSRGETEGIGVRVLVDGAWGFASSGRMDGPEADRIAALAVRIARASARHAHHPVHLSERPPAVGRYETPVEEDPFEVPVDRTVDMLLEAERAMAAVPGTTTTKADYHAFREWRDFHATDGSHTGQVITHVGASLEANAASTDDLQRRSYPESGGYRAAGYEHVRGLDLLGRAPTLAGEAVELLSAPVLPPGRRTVILHPSQLYLQIHESCGHPTELDRVFGTEAAYAGTSFLTTDKLDAGFAYGSDQVTIVADATTPGGLGTFGWDDEGVVSQKVPLVSEGAFTGYLSSRETAPRIGRSSGGAMRADGWNRLPLIRMTNINLEPRPGMSLEDIIADTEDGLLFENNRSWSIDDRRLNFQFGVEVAHEVKGGKVGQLYRNATYTGITPRFWGSCDAVADERSWELVGVTNCGKGQPGQGMHVGHGSSGARFRDVEIGVGNA
ncbi:MAG: TldD/PmbA family protein [Planctomycetota bacterium]|nr:MAG: TldD/PmbA family protein [Planctomycetota bacterium]